MNILYCQTAYPPSTGGAQTHLHEIARRMKAQNNVEVITHWKENRTDWLRGVTVNAPENSEYVQDGVSVQQINFTSQEKSKIVFPAWIYYFLMNYSVNTISDRLFSKLEAAVGPVDVVHVGRIGREFLAWAAYKLAKKRGVPFVLTPFHHPRWTGWRYQSYIQLYCLADAVMALTHAEKDILVGLGVSKEKIHVIGHAPVLLEQEPQSGYFGPGGPVVLFLGQKYAYKGIAQMLGSMKKVWQKFPDIRFAFIGPRTRYSRGQFRKYKDPRIIEQDRVSEEKKRAALADCAIFSLPSQQESFGGVYTEAWQMGKPVIGCRIPAVTELIDIGVNGELVNSSSESLALAIIRLLENPKQREAMGRMGQQKVIRQFNWEQIVKKQETIYQNLIK
jgi:alpha-maltose-1-phosphate synthase